MSSLKDYNFRLTIDDVRKMPQSGQKEVRWNIQTDLRFLANCILRPRNKKFLSYKEEVQGAIIDHFPKCRPDKDILEWEDKDEFIVMASRGMLKSTIGMAFLTQVILCAPDVRILIMSGKIDKAASILAGACKPFATNEVIRYLFPEWAVDPDDIKAEEFVCPKRDPELDTALRDKTMSLASFDSIKAGGHHELIFLDDATNEQNSNTLENCEKTHGTYDDIDELMEPGGLRVFLATKWHNEDLPEYIRVKAEEEKTISGVDTLSYFRLPAWEVRTDGTPRQVKERTQREKLGQLTPDDVILAWPEKLTAKFLFKKYRKNRADFYKQYLLDASLEGTAKSFTPEILEKQIQSPTELYQIPLHDRAVVIHWDLATVFTGRRKKSETDFSCGLVAVFQLSTGKCFIADAVLAHFNTGRDIAESMIRLYQTALFFGPVVGHSMEDAMGARNLESQIMEIAKDANVDLPPIQWELPDSKPNAKNSRIAILASVMKDGRVVLLSNIPFLEDIRAQFEKWSIDAKRRKDDAPDCIAQIWQYYSTKMFPKNIESMKPNGPVISWEPELPAEETDSHASESTDADIEYLNSFTAPHAE